MHRSPAVAASRLGALGHAAVLCAVLLLSACSSFRPWTNSPAPAPIAFQRATPTKEHPLVVVVALSGGGARAGAFGLGVLRELKATEFTLNGQPTTLLDQLNLISGVSGGSILAAHFAAFGDASLSSFESDFLRRDFQADVIQQTLSPVHLHRLSSPWYGRGHVLAERLNELYQGRTYADVLDRPHAPELLITATDLTTGAPFEFNPEQFALICADLRSVPLSFAVAASSAVPVVLAPMTVRNFAGSCPSPATAQTTSTDNYRARLLRSTTQSYLGAKERPYIHLVDGGIADNLGIRTVLDRLIANGSLSTTFGAVAPGSIRKVILIAVNSERGLIEDIDESDHVPTISQVLGSLIFGAATRVTQTTLAMMKDDVQHWRHEIAEQRGAQQSPFAEDADLYLISVSLQDAPDDKHKALLSIPTALTIDGKQVDELIEAGRRVLRDSSEFQRVRRSLANESPARTITTLSTPAKPAEIE